MPQIFLVWIPAANVVFTLSNQFNCSCFRFTVTWRLNQPRDLFLLCLTVFTRSIARNIKNNPSNFWRLLTKFEGFLAPRAGLEPATSWLTVMRSTDWANEDYEILHKACVRFFWYSVRLTLCNAEQVLYRLSYGGMHARTVLTNLNSSPAHAEEYFLWKIFFQSLSYRTYARTISNLF